MQLNSNQIQEVLPHRYPFLLMDKIVDGEPGAWAKEIKCATTSGSFLCGYFPRKHVVSDVLIIETLAQVGAVAVLSMEESRGEVAFFGGIKNARFRQQVMPGDVLELTCELTRQRGPIGFGTATATVNGKVTASAELTFTIGD